MPPRWPVRDLNRRSDPPNQRPTSPLRITDRNWEGQISPMHQQHRRALGNGWHELGTSDLLVPPTARPTSHTAIVGAQVVGQCELVSRRSVELMQEPLPHHHPLVLLRSLSVS